MMPDSIPGGKLPAQFRIRELTGGFSRNGVQYIPERALIARLNLRSSIARAYSAGKLVTLTLKSAPESAWYWQDSSGAWHRDGRP